MWSAVKDATAAFESAGIHGAHGVRRTRSGPGFADDILAAKELLALLPS
jgi:hypothetical protein